jgi:hypothetical protein
MLDIEVRKLMPSQVVKSTAMKLLQLRLAKVETIEWENYKALKIVGFKCVAIDGGYSSLTTKRLRLWCWWEVESVAIKTRARDFEGPSSRRLIDSISRA